MRLRFHPLRFSFFALESLYFPPGKSANILRGAFGSIFRKIACAPECTNAKSCEQRSSCPYAQMFEPSALPGFPSGLIDLPRPFVFRAWHLDGTSIPAGGEFYFDLNLFDLQGSAIAYLVLTFAQLAKEGLGSRRSQVELATVWQLDLEGAPQTKIFDGTIFATVNPEPVSLELTHPFIPLTHLELRFVTPTELKAEAGLANQPHFGILAARIRDRVSTLSQIYGDGPLAIDFAAFSERARLVKMTRCAVQQVDVRRKSSRSGQVHSIGGFVGEAEYQGKLEEFVPYLRAAKWTGIGRQTVWGKGEVEILQSSLKN